MSEVLQLVRDRVRSATGSLTVRETEQGSEGREGLEAHEDSAKDEDEGHLVGRNDMTDLKQTIITIRASMVRRMESRIQGEMNIVVMS